METVPNQKKAIIHRIEPLDNPSKKIFTGDGLGFLGVNNKSWKASARDLGAQALLLYLYFVDNANNYDLVISPQAIKNEIGMPITTFRDQIKKLEKKGYLVWRQGNLYDFYEVPELNPNYEKTPDEDECVEKFMETLGVSEKTVSVSTHTPEDREINIINSDGDKKSVISNDVGADFLKAHTDENGNFRF